MKVLAISIIEFGFGSEKRNGTSLYAASVIESLGEVCDLEICLMRHPSHDHLPSHWNVKLYALSPIRSFVLRQIRSFYVGIKSAVWQYQSDALAQYLRSLKEGSFDAVLFLEESACIFEKFIPTSIPRILTRHNLDSRSTKLELGSPSRFLRSVVTRYVSRRFDHWTCARFSAITLGSSSEVKTLEKISKNAKILWFPTISIYDIPDQPVAAPEIDDSGAFKAIFIGDFRYGPNVDAIKWLLGCERYFEKATLKALEIVLVGRNPPELSARTAIQISKMGFVSDLIPVLSLCEIGIIPIVSGSGVKIKALTLLGSGMPVVTTPAGVEGLGVKDGVHCLIARTQAEFAAAVERLHRDQRLRESLRSESRSFILNNFSKQNQTAALRALLDGIYRERFPNHA